MSLIPTRSHTCVEIDHEIISLVILLLSLIQEGLCQLQAKDVHKVLVNRLVKLAQENVIRLTGNLDMTIVVEWDIKPQTKQNKITKEHSNVRLSPENMKIVRKHLQMMLKFDNLLFSYLPNIPLN